MLNQSDLKTGERLLTEEEVEKTTLNERAQQRYAQNTILDFSGSVQYIAKKTNRGENLVFVARKIAGDGKTTEDARIPATMVLRAPWVEDDRKPLENTTACERDILACLKADNPGKALKNLLKGKRIKVLYDVSCQDTPYGKSAKESVQFNVFDWA